MPDYTQSYLEWHHWLLEPLDFFFVFLCAAFLTWARKKVQATTEKLGKKWDVEDPYKFSESCWKSMFYITSFAWGVYTVYQENIFPETANCWRNYPYISPSLAVRIFYLYELGFYVHSTYAHLTMEVERSDFWPLFFHHIVTICLIYFSYAIGYFKIGLLVLVCHDIGDIPLETGKLAVYAKKEGLQIVLYLCLVVGWAVSRLYIYPFYILRSSWQECLDMVGPESVKYRVEFNIGLFFLQILHVYWFILILRIGYRALFQRNFSDIREKSDSASKMKAE